MATPTPIPATRMCRWRRAAAALCMALAAAQYPHVHASSVTTSGHSNSNSNSIPFGVSGVTTSAPLDSYDARGASNAGVQPEVNMVSMDELRSLVNSSSGANGVEILNPFTPAPSSSDSLTTADSSTPVPTAPTSSLTPTPTPSPATTTPTPIPTATRGANETERTETPEPSNDPSGSLSPTSVTEDLSKARAQPIGRRGVITSAPSPVPLADDVPVETPTPSVSKKSTNAIAFDVVSPQSSSSNSGDKEPTTETEAPSQSPAPEPTPSPGPSPSSPPSPAPSSTPSPSPTPSKVTPAPSATPATAVSTPPPTAAVREGQIPTVAPGSKTPAPSDKGIALLAESALPASAGPGAGHSSSNGESVVGHSKKGNSTVESSGSGESTDSSTSSSSQLYSMGTTSILSIVGVIVGICVIVSLFVLISRRKYEDEDDDHDVLNYGGGGIKFDLDRRGTNSIVRLSPTFLMNGIAPPAPGQPMEPDFGSLSPEQIIASNRGRAPAGAIPEPSPAPIMESYVPQQRNFISESDRSSRAFDSNDELSTLDSRESDGWSSVLESDFDLRSASRCTRDTTFSNITMSQNFSEFNPADLRSGTYRRTTKASSQPQEYNIDEEYDDTASVMSYADSSAPPHGARSTGESSFRMSGYSDYRSTDQSLDHSSRSRAPYM